MHLLLFTVTVTVKNIHRHLKPSYVNDVQFSLHNLAHIIWELGDNGFDAFAYILEPAAETSL